MKEEGLLMRALAPLSYWVALGLLYWATHPRFGRVRPLHPDAAYIGRRIYHYRRLLAQRGQII